MVHFFDADRCSIGCILGDPLCFNSSRLRKGSLAQRRRRLQLDAVAFNAVLAALARAGKGQVRREDTLGGLNRGLLFPIPILKL